MKLHYIAGQWTAPDSGEFIQVLAPATGLEIGNLARGNARDIDAAVRAARQALAGPWGSTTAIERGRILMQMAQRVAAESNDLLALEALDTGKPLATARNDIAVLVRYLEFYGSAADKLHGDVIPFDPRYVALMLREPLGVTAHILPWNYPAQMFGRSVVPALAMGNAVVLKPSEEACLSILRLVEIAAECGVPAGALNVVTGYGVEAGAALAGHPDIDFVTFTGSNEAGARVQAAAAAHAVKVSLELGGKSPQIVFEDADLDRAIPIIVAAITQNAGQTCTAGSRLLVQRSIYADFVQLVSAAFAGIRVGTPDMDLACGPLISQRQLDRVDGYVRRAHADGIPILAEGRLAGHLPPGGFYMKPVMFGPVPADHFLAQEEVFGPVLCVMPFDDEADAIRIANDTPYGLIAAVWSDSGARQMRVAKAVRAGQVFINCYGAGGGVELPFGGVKRSGHGREKGLMALEEMSTTKTVLQYHG